MKPVKVSSSDVPTLTERGGEIKIMISPKTVDKPGFILGLSTLAPDEVVNNHIHDYSHEAFYVLQGQGNIIFADGEIISFGVGDSVFVPKGMPHRIINTGDTKMKVIFTATPLAPSPELGHREI